MTFAKPKNITYVDMCKYFDAHIYDDPAVRDDNTLYKYLYHIYYMLACEAKYFYKFEDYDNYAIYAANKIYIRITNRKDDTNKIKSILNYAKATRYPLKLEYQNSSFTEIFDKTYKKVDTTELEYIYKDMIQAQYRSGLSSDLIDTINKVDDIIKKVIIQTPYKYDKLMCHRLYISCCVSFLKNITFSKLNSERLIKRVKNNTLTADFLAKLYKNEKDNCITLWQLPDSMHDYIVVLLNKIKHNFMQEIVSVISSFELPDTLLQDILWSSYTNAPQNNTYFLGNE